MWDEDLVDVLGGIQTEFVLRARLHVAVVGDQLSMAERRESGKELDADRLTNKVGARLRSSKAMPGFRRTCRSLVSSSDLRRPRLPPAYSDRGMLS